MKIPKQERLDVVYIGCNDLYEHLTYGKSIPNGTILESRKRNETVMIIECNEFQTNDIYVTDIDDIDLIQGFLWMELFEIFY